MGLKVFVNTADAVESIRSVLEQAREATKMRRGGPVTLCLMDAELPGEVDMLIGKNYPVNPQIKGAIKSLVGVLTVEEA